MSNQFYQKLRDIINSPEAKINVLTYDYIGFEICKIFKIKIAEGKIDPEFAKDVQEVIMDSIKFSDY